MAAKTPEEKLKAAQATTRELRTTIKQKDKDHEEYVAAAVATMEAQQERFKEQQKVIDDLNEQVRALADNPNIQGELKTLDGEALRPHEAQLGSFSGPDYSEQLHGIHAALDQIVEFFQDVAPGMTAAPIFFDEDDHRDLEEPGLRA